MRSGWVRYLPSRTARTSRCEIRRIRVRPRGPSIRSLDPVELADRRRGGMRGRMAAAVICSSISMGGRPASMIRLAHASIFSTPAITRSTASEPRANRRSAGAPSIHRCAPARAVASTVSPPQHPRRAAKMGGRFLPVRAKASARRARRCSRVRTLTPSRSAHTRVGAVMREPSTRKPSRGWRRMSRHNHIRCTSTSTTGMHVPGCSRPALRRGRVAAAWQRRKSCTSGPRSTGMPSHSAMMAAARSGETP